jgi:hypothetical protein
MTIAGNITICLPAIDQSKVEILTKDVTLYNVSVEQDNALMLNDEQVVEVFDRQLSKSELHTVNVNCVAGFCIKDVIGVM